MAPAKLTVSLSVTGRRRDGYHELEAEMVTVDLCDELLVDPRGDHLVVTGVEAHRVPGSPHNLAWRALRTMGRHAGVLLDKRIPPGAGLGGGSADAGALLRWAGVTDAATAARLGADVPFCTLGGRAKVGGVGEVVEPLPHEERAFTLLLVPLEVPTAAVYRRFDDLGPAGGRNDLEAAALAVEPRLTWFRDLLGEVSGREPVLAGSGSAYFVEGSVPQVPPSSQLRGARLLEVHAVPAGFGG